MQLFCDIDGTIADCGEAIRRRAWQLFEVELPQGAWPYNIRDIFSLVVDDSWLAEQMAAELFDDIWKNPTGILAMGPIWPVWSAVRDWMSKRRIDAGRVDPVDDDADARFGVAEHVRFVTARPPASTFAGAGDPTRDWLRQWGLEPLGVQGGLLYSSLFSDGKAGCLTDVLLNLRDRLLGQWSGGRELSDIQLETVLILEDKPEEICSLALAAGQWFKQQLAKPQVTSRAVIREKIQVVVLGVPQPWNGFDARDEVWGAVRKDYGVDEECRSTALAELRPSVRVMWPTHVDGIGDWVESVLKEEEIGR